MRDLYEDLVRESGATHPCYITDHVTDDDMRLQDGHLLAHIDEPKASHLCNTLRSTQVVDLILFGSGNHTELLEALVRQCSSEFLHVSRLVILAAHYAKTLRPRLDQNVVFYDKGGRGFLLSEAYNIGEKRREHCTL